MAFLRIGVVVCFALTFLLGAATRAAAFCGIDDKQLTDQQRARLDEWHREVAEEAGHTIHGIMELFEKACDAVACAKAGLTPEEQLRCVVDGPEDGLPKAKREIIRAAHRTPEEKEHFLREIGWGVFVDANRAVRELETAQRSLFPDAERARLCHKFTGEWEEWGIRTPDACKGLLRARKTPSGY